MASWRTLSSSSVIIIFFFFITLSESKDFMVGGKNNAWKIPSSSSESLNQWAEQTRFKIGDSLIWKYEKEKDSVLLVNREDYMSCNTSNPLSSHKDGNTVVKLDRSGPFYFISGEEGRCEKGEKLVVVVLSSGRRHEFYTNSPAPSPVEFFFDGPAIAPTSGGSRLVALRSGFVVGGLVILLGLMGMVL